MLEMQRARCSWGRRVITDGFRLTSSLLIRDGDLPILLQHVAPYSSANFAAYCCVSECLTLQLRNVLDGTQLQCMSLRNWTVSSKLPAARAQNPFAAAFESTHHQDRPSCMSCISHRLQKVPFHTNQNSPGHQSQHTSGNEAPMPFTNVLHGSLAFQTRPIQRQRSAATRRMPQHGAQHAAASAAQPAALAGDFNVCVPTRSSGKVRLKAACRHLNLCFSSGAHLEPSEAVLRTLRGAEVRCVLGKSSID